MKERFYSELIVGTLVTSNDNSRPRMMPKARISVTKFRSVRAGW